MASIKGRGNFSSYKHHKTVKFLASSSPGLVPVVLSCAFSIYGDAKSLVWAKFHSGCHAEKIGFLTEFKNG